jgi:transposase
MNTPYHVIGLDIHKRMIAFCEKRLDGETVCEGTFLAGCDAIEQWAAQRTMPWIGGLEATLFSGYVYDTLLPYAIDLRVGHPLKLKAISTAKHKNDRLDAQMLANLLRADLFPTCYMASPVVRELKRILRYRNFVVRQAVALKNKTTGLLMEVGAPYDSRRIHGEKYFEEFLGTLTDVPESVVEMLRTTRGGLQMFQSIQQRLVRSLLQHDLLQERTRRLMSIKGVGEITALTWVLEIDDPQRFSNLKKVQSYCGLCSGQDESAGKARRAPLSKQRNAHLQTVLIEAAKLAPRWNPSLARVHAAEMARCNQRNRATCAVARKLVAYLMAVDRSGKPYEERSPAL